MYNDIVINERIYMSHNNPLTVKRHRKALADMIVDIMKNEDKSLLEAYATLASLATSDEVVELAKDKVNKLNESVSDEDYFSYMSTNDPDLGAR